MGMIQQIIVSTAAVTVTLNGSTAATVTIGSTASDKLSNVENMYVC